MKITWRQRCSACRQTFYGPEKEMFVDADGLLYCPRCAKGTPQDTVANLLNMTHA